MDIDHAGLRPVVHLELNTADQEAATAFYVRLLSTPQGGESAFWQPKR